MSSYSRTHSLLLSGWLSPCPSTDNHGLQEITLRGLLLLAHPLPLHLVTDLHSLSQLQVFFEQVPGAGVTTTSLRKKRLNLTSGSCPT